MDDVGWQVAFAIDSCRRVQRAERRLEKAKADLEVAAEENKTGESFPIQDIQVWGNKIRLEVDLNEGQEDEEESGEDEEQSEASHH